MRRNKFIDIPDHARRNFIKWSVGLGAALGLRPWKVFEVQESIVGPALADQASCSPVNRSLHVIAGNGGFAWFTQLWPHADQATKAGASFYMTGKATAQDASGAGDHPITLGPDAPFAVVQQEDDRRSWRGRTRPTPASLVPAAPTSPPGCGYLPCSGGAADHVAHAGAIRN